ncbi:MAG: SDR family oxidoreductase [Pseudomonadota bacterium]
MTDTTLSGQVAIVTGAGRGIGRGIAIAYARAGAKVCVASRTKSTVDEVVALIKSEGGEAIGVRCDVSSADDIQSMVESTVNAYGTVHILVNNAQSFGTAEAPTGAALPHPFEDTSEDEWQWIFHTGVIATVRAMKAVFPHMKGQGYGRIINMASSSGQMRKPGFSAYGSIKDAIRCLSGISAREWGQHGITVNSMSPLVVTDTLADWIEACPEDSNAVLQHVPMGRFGDSIEDCAPVAVFLASKGAGYVTGQNYNVEGGFNMFP